MKALNIQTHGLPKVVSERIQEHIVKSNLRSGDVIPTEKELSEQLGVSRTVVREALRGLEARGFIEARHGKGRFVSQFSLEKLVDTLSCGLAINVTDFRHVLDIRIRLEDSFLASCTPNYGKADIKLFRANQERMQRLVERQPEVPEEKLLQAHKDWHAALYRKVGNPLLLDLINTFSNMQHGLTMFQSYLSCDRPRFVRDHGELLKAIETGDSAIAGAALRRHFAEVTEWVEAAGKAGTVPEHRPAPPAAVDFS
jgi:DNA-binding FadR family transcriptional regulator